MAIVFGSDVMRSAGAPDKVAAIANLAMFVTPTNKLSLRTTFNRSTDDEARTYRGSNNEDLGGLVEQAFDELGQPENGGPALEVVSIERFSLNPDDAQRVIRELLTVVAVPL